MLDIPVSTVRAIIKKYEQHGTTASLPRTARPKKISSRAERNTLKNIAANPRLTSKDIQKSLAAADVHVHDSTVRKLLSKNGIHGCVARKKPLLSKKFVKEYNGKHEAFWRSILWSDESKIELFGRNKKNLVLTVKHGGGSILVWACFAAGRPGNLTVIDSLINSSVYQSILDEHVKVSARKLYLGTKWILQQDNDPKHSSKSTVEWLQKNRIKVLPWPSQSPDLNPIEMLWRDLKAAVHQRKPSNLTQLKQYCMEEWAKISPSRCEKLISGYKKQLEEVILAKGGATSY
ncbi:hypothetical protein LDENG_00274330 [Lucifuga dentata]|nr:hypothetical protein LDENG_00274330 [Lucifuga dentata]